MRSGPRGVTAEVARAIAGCACALGFAGAIAACSTDTILTNEVVTTAIGIDPEDFLGTLPCSSEPGAAQSYTVTFNNVSTGQQAVVTSAPVSCSVPVSYQHVTQGDLYSATVALYSVPAAQVLATHPKPDWTTICANDPAHQAVVVIDQLALVHGCTLVNLPGAGKTGVSFRKSASVSNQIASLCGEDSGIDSLTIVPTGENAGPLAPQSVECASTDAIEYLIGITGGKTYTFEVQAFAKGATEATSATTCVASAKEGIEVQTACGSLSSIGSIFVDVPAALKSLSLSCGTGDSEVATYDVSFDASSSNTSGTTPIIAKGLACTQSAPLGPAARGNHDGDVYFRDSSGIIVGHASCFAAVEPGSEATAVCSAD